MPPLTDKAASFARTETEEGKPMNAVPEMIEKVARALCLYDRGKDDDWDAQVYLESARAAIAAMREPVEAQLATIHNRVRIECRPGDQTASILNAREVLQASVDAALGKPPVAR